MVVLNPFASQDMGHHRNLPLKRNIFENNRKKLYFDQHLFGRIFDKPFNNTQVNNTMHLWFCSYWCFKFIKFLESQKLRNFLGFPEQKG